MAGEMHEKGAAWWGCPYRISDLEILGLSDHARIGAW